MARRRTLAHVAVLTDHADSDTGQPLHDRTGLGGDGGSLVASDDDQQVELIARLADHPVGGMPFGLGTARIAEQRGSGDHSALKCGARDLRGSWGQFDQTLGAERHRH